MKTKLKKISYWAGVGAVGIVLGISLQFTRAWVEPTVAPPGGSIGAPINTGNVTQVKEGILGAGNSAGSEDYGQTYMTKWGMWSAGDIYIEPTSGKTLTLVPAEWDNSGALNVLFNKSYFSGNVGIGTSSPGSKVEIKGSHSDTRMRLNSIGDGGSNDAQLSFWASEPGWTYTGTGIGNNIDGSPYYGRINSSRGGSHIRLLDNAISFNTISSSGADTNNLYMSGGNVGIGTTAPTQKLDVNGNVRVAGKLYANQTNCEWVASSYCGTNGVAWIDAVCPVGKIMMGSGIIGCTGTGPTGAFCDDASRCQKPRVYCCGGN